MGRAWPTIGSVARIFTLEEVEALIPELNRLVGIQLDLKVRIERSLSELLRETGEVPTTLEATASDTPQSRKLKSELAGLVSTYNDGWQSIQALGAVVKDPQIGLLDFYGRVDGRLVWLCWKFGEEHLGYFHDLDAGFAGRRPLRTETRSKLMN